MVPDFSTGDVDARTDRQAGSVLARHMTLTGPAPAVNSARASADTVAVVVITSSTIMMCSPVNGRRTAKAFLIFWKRAGLDSRFWGWVSMIRRQLPSSSGTDQAFASVAAITADWLKPRRRSVRRCNGTGTITSGRRPVGVSSISSVSTRPVVSCALFLKSLIILLIGHR